MRKALVVGVILVAGALLGWYGRHTVAAQIFVQVRQPIAFNHKKHVEQVGMECIDCHPYYKTQANSGRPGIDTCLLCHDQAQTKSKEEEKIREYAKQGAEIPWQRIYFMSDHVRFSHQLHAQKAQIQCRVCHGDFAQLETPPSRPLVLQTMEFCVNCHKETNSSEDCLACHR